MMSKSLRSIAIIIVCITILVFGYIFYQTKRQRDIEVNTKKLTIVSQLEGLNRLETATMYMQKMVEGKQGLEDLLPNVKRDNIVQDFLFEDSMQMIAYATITAGFDLTGFNSGSIQINTDNSVTLILPKAIILQATLSPGTKPFLRKRGILSQGDLQLETQIRDKTLETMKEEAISKGLLTSAEQKAKDSFHTLLLGFGMQLKDIIIK